jgi:hypothetical protein
VNGLKPGAPRGPQGGGASKSLFSNIYRKRAKQLIVSRGAVERVDREASNNFYIPVTKQKKFYIFFYKYCSVQ